MPLALSLPFILSCSHLRTKANTIYRWSIGSLLFLTSWAFMMGPYQYATHLISGPRLPFTATYFGAIALTIYSAVGVS